MPVNDTADGTSFAVEMSQFATTKRMKTKSESQNPHSQIHVVDFSDRDILLEVRTSRIIPWTGIA
jgi:hypothetical protein